MNHSYDLAVIGGGAAGLLCAARAGQRGLRVLLLEHNDRLAKKLLISGGGRCNFTNLYCTPNNFYSQNPHFVKSALARFTVQDFVDLVKSHKIDYYEKTKGQLFCRQSAKDILQLLVDQCRMATKSGGLVEILTGMQVNQIQKLSDHFALMTSRGEFTVGQVVVATGGLSIAKIGASDFGLRIARQFGLSVIPMQPALVPLTLPWEQYPALQALSGMSAEVQISATRNGKGSKEFQDSLLFTHRGLSGPATLQASLYWSPGDSIRLNFSPAYRLIAGIEYEKQLRGGIGVDRYLENILPSRLVQALLEIAGVAGGSRLADLNRAQVSAIAKEFEELVVSPSGSEGFLKAEVSRGGVDTSELSSQTMEARKVPGLYFIGEVVDVTGELGGFNFQWAWSSAVVCAESVAQ